MTKDLLIRNIPEDMFIQLHMMKKEQNFPSFNAFMLAQLEKICQLDGLNLYDNAFSKSLTEIKEQQNKILELLIKNEITILGVSGKQEIVEELTVSWLNRVMIYDETEIDAYFRSSWPLYCYLNSLFRW